MNTSSLTICICGGGNLGHTVAGYAAAKKQFSVNLLTNHPERWQRGITASPTDPQNVPLTGRITSR